MLLAQHWTLLVVLLIGNCGFWLFCFNRINATGLHRTNIKKIEKLLILLCFAIPILIAVCEGPLIGDWLQGLSGSWWPDSSPLFRLYGSWCLASFLVLGTLWLESRLWLLPPRHLEHQASEQYDVHAKIDGGSPGDKLTSLLRKLPGNQICRLSVTQKQLSIPRRVRGIDGLRIGHLSDLHFTGQLRVEHFHFVMDRMLELDPELVIISGDIIDYTKCLPWIAPVLGKLSPRYGCSFVLGNHDCRLTDVNSLSNQIESLGYCDLGKQNQVIELDSGTNIELIGNEIPWLNRQPEEPKFHSAESGGSDDVLRICVSHSPDQIPWARKKQADLMFAGHTHGGQVRLPGIGPIVAPSYQGTRFASGVFYLAPTLVHVSRGVSGTHPLRWRCLPEISLLTLKSPTTA